MSCLPWYEELASLEVYDLDVLPVLLSQDGCDVLSGYVRLQECDKASFIDCEESIAQIFELAVRERVNTTAVKYTFLRLTANAEFSLALSTVS